MSDSAGIIYYQLDYYDEDQMKNIHEAFGNRYEHAPKVVFGDHYINKYREINTNRTNRQGQAAIVGKYDRKFGFGIAVTFKTATEKESTVSFENFKKLLQAEFRKLELHLINGGDVIIPCPTQIDLEKNPSSYFVDNVQVIKHNIGTGKAGLPMPWLMEVQKEMDALIRSAMTTKVIKKKLYEINLPKLSMESDEVKSVSHDQNFVYFLYA